MLTKWTLLKDTGVIKSARTYKWSAVNDSLYAHWLVAFVELGKIKQPRVTQNFTHADSRVMFKK